MRRISLSKTFVFLPFLLCVACMPAEKEDSAEIAQSKNEENFGTLDEEKEADFVVKAVEDRYAEIKLAQLAIAKSSDASLKEIASILEKDNSKVLDELKDLSYKKGIAIPVGESESFKNEIQDLQQKDQNDFNKDWLKKITDQQESAIKNFESMQKKTQDVELKLWIDGTLPNLHGHLNSLIAYQDKFK